jgi:hypothetical protein
MTTRVRSVAAWQLPLEICRKATTLGGVDSCQRIALATSAHTQLLLIRAQPSHPPPSHSSLTVTLRRGVLVCADWVLLTGGWRAALLSSKT